MGVRGGKTKRVLADFDSGDPTRGGFLRGRALADHVEGASRCLVACRDGRVAWFYALASAAAERAGTSMRLRRNLPDSVPVILLSRPAINRKEQGKRVGAYVLRDTFIRAVAAAEIVSVGATAGARGGTGVPRALRFRALTVRSAAPAAVDWRGRRPAWSAAEVTG